MNLQDSNSLSGENYQLSDFKASYTDEELVEFIKIGLSNKPNSIEIVSKNKNTSVSELEELISSPNNRNLLGYLLEGLYLDDSLKNISKSQKIIPQVRLKLNNATAIDTDYVITSDKEVKIVENKWGNDEKNIIETLDRYLKLDFDNNILLKGKNIILEIATINEINFKSYEKAFIDRGIKLVAKKCDFDFEDINYKLLDSDQDLKIELENIIKGFFAKIYSESNISDKCILPLKSVDSFYPFFGKYYDQEHKCFNPKIEKDSSEKDVVKADVIEISNQVKKIKKEAEIILKSRGYQKKAIKEIINHTLSLVKDKLERDDGGIYDTAALLEMATGSGKTYTTGKILDRLIRRRNIYNQKFNKKEFEGLNVLVLTNKIDGLSQFRDDLIYGRNNKSAILSKNIRNNLNVSTYHSKGDNLDDVEDKYYTQDEKIENSVGNSKNIKDNFTFCTFQTAIKKGLVDKSSNVDMIIIDEAHNINEKNSYSDLIQDLSTKGRDGKAPMLLPITATPTNKTKDLFGDSIYEFGLGKYLASEYSPGVDYKLMTNPDISPEDMQELNELLNSAKEEEDFNLKKIKVKELETRLTEIMSKYSNLDKMVDDLLSKLNTSEQTVLFAKDIPEADRISELINKKINKNISLSYHSTNDKNKGLEKLGNKEINILVTVNKVNESVDLEAVNNIVFWRNTKSQVIFLQQFGRGLRGDGTVKYYDFVGGLSHFSWLGDIHKEYKKEINELSDIERKSLEDKVGNLDSRFGIDTGSIESGINLGDIGMEVCELIDIVFPKNKIYELNEDLTVEIDGTIYTVVSDDNMQLICSYGMAIDRIKKQDKEWKSKNILEKSTMRGRKGVDLYNLEELLKILPTEKILYELNDDLTVEIDGTIYTVVSNDNIQFECSYGRAQNRIKKQDKEWKSKNILEKSVSKRGYLLDLYNLEELLKILPTEKILYELNDDLTVEIDGIIYTVVSDDNIQLKCSYGVAKYEIEKQDKEWISKNILEKSTMRGGYLVGLYNLEELLKILPTEKILYELNDDLTVEIDGIIYTVISNDNIQLKCSSGVAKYGIKKQDKEWKSKNILKKSGKRERTVDLYNLEELLKILPKNKR